jgi:hypothetical protein
MPRTVWDVLSREQVRDLVLEHHLKLCIARPSYSGSSIGRAMVLRTTDYTTGRPFLRDWSKLVVSEGEFFAHLSSNNLVVAHPRSARRPEFVRVIWDPAWRELAISAGWLKRPRRRRTAGSGKYRRRRRGRKPPT